MKKISPSQFSVRVEVLGCIPSLMPAKPFYRAKNVFSFRIGLKFYMLHKLGLQGKYI
jgi:hypothetical protein